LPRPPEKLEIARHGPRRPSPDDRARPSGERDWPRLAVELGFFDQAHFIKAFKAVIGLPPGDYGSSSRKSQASRSA
jgi:hypothetical protein